jgi:hypothetical protein
MKAGISVDTVQFILFLYIQQVHKISLRESLVGSQEEYPLKGSVTVHFLSFLTDSTPPKYQAT